MNMKKHLLIVSAISLLIAGCQSSQTIKQDTVESGGFMHLWNTYSHCQRSTEFELLRHDASVLSVAAGHSLSQDAQDAFVLPLPGKLDKFVAAPSARFAVDVKAMSAACSLRAGQAAIQVQQIEIARELLNSIFAYRPQSDYVSYSLQAKAMLSELGPSNVKLQVSLNIP